MSKDWKIIIAMWVIIISDAILYEIFHFGFFSMLAILLVSAFLTIAKAEGQVLVNE